MKDHKTRIIRIYENRRPKKEPAWWCGDRGNLASLPAMQPEFEIPTGRPFSLPTFIGPQFAALRGYWNSLRRGTATIPFTDDFKLSGLGKLADTAALISVFQNPQRFRFDVVGKDIGACYGGDLENRFADQLAARMPLDYLLSQCSATTESAAPTFYYGAHDDGTAEYQRLMLPFWCDARVNAILVAFELGHAQAHLA